MEWKVSEIIGGTKKFEQVKRKTLRLFFLKCWNVYDLLQWTSIRPIINIAITTWNTWSNPNAYANNQIFMSHSHLPFDFLLRVHDVETCSQRSQIKFPFSCMRSLTMFYFCLYSFGPISLRYDMLSVTFSLASISTISLLFTLWLWHLFTKILFKVASCCYCCLLLLLYEFAM